MDIYSEYIASFSIPRERINQFELLIGFHPLEKRFFSEREDRLSCRFLQFVDQNKLTECDYFESYQKLAKLYIDEFPELRNYKHNEDIIKYLWQNYIEHFDIIELGYLFPNQINDRWEKHKDRIIIENKKIRDEINQKTNKKLKGTGRIACTVNIPLNGFVGDLIEQTSGISKEIKEHYSLLDYPSGFIAKYLKSNDISKVLTPTQFEEFVGKIFEAEGWSIQLTKKTRDGGKDLIATKLDSVGNKHLAYIEAKRYKEKNVIGIGLLKQFFATILIDNVEKGFFVTSSAFSKPAIKLISDNEICSTRIQLMDRIKLQEKINNLAQNELTPYLMRK